MAKITVWFDAESDFLELLFNDNAGFMRETDNDCIMERVDNFGNVIGFTILGVSQCKDKLPFEFDLPQLLTTQS